MTPNPYQPPGYGPQQGSPPPPGPVNRTPFVLAAAGAFLASAYWGAIALLIMAGAAAGGGGASAIQGVLPFVLVGLYAFRGIQLFKGDPRAAQRILWLHGIGAVVALLQAVSGGGGIVAVLQGIKVLINVFGAVTAYAAYRSVIRPAYRG